MPDFTLTLIDIRRVQSYLFNANELKQNLGASALVEQATHDWIVESLSGRHNVLKPAPFQFVVDDKFAIERGELDVEVIFLGGGNAAILFLNIDDARGFAKKITKKLLLNAPGLEAAVAHRQVDLSTRGAFRQAWKDLNQVEMPKQKEGRAVSQPVLGLAVTAECAYTGLPAVEEDQDGVLLSAEAYVKQTKKTVDLANDRLSTLLNIEKYTYPLDFDDLGGEHGHARFIAVVHVDGNGMGQRIREFTEQDDNNREMIGRMRAISTKVNDIGLKSMQSVRDWLADAIRVGDGKIADRYDVELSVTLKNSYLPLRPLVFGGDDITIVCDGRLGLALAAALLENFAQADLPDEIKAYACAGVAIVHSHYPFARAYALAEELCHDAKKQARIWDEKSRVSLINWHKATSGLTLDWDEIKKREYQNGKLLLRPLAVAQAKNISSIPAWRTWGTFLEQVKGFRDKDDHWSTQRNKLKDLQDVLRKGFESTRQFTDIHGGLPSVTALHGTDVESTGWHADQCIYFDALEALDLFIYPKEA